VGAHDTLIFFGANTMSSAQRIYASGAIAAGVVGTFGATLVGSAEGITNIASLAANFIQVGAPCMAGSAISQMIMPVEPDKYEPTKEKVTHDAQAALVGGAATAAVLIISGALPAVFDSQLVSFVLLASMAVYAGEFVVRYTAGNRPPM
jgi:hypothetical protein